MIAKAYLCWFALLKSIDVGILSRNVIPFQFLQD